MALNFSEDRGKQKPPATNDSDRLVLGMSVIIESMLALLEDALVCWAEASNHIVALEYQSRSIEGTEVVFNGGKSKATNKGVPDAKRNSDARR